MEIPFFQVDAFTDQPFKGNPAAVCITDSALPETTMQQIAAENNLAETAFVSQAAGTFNLRWFTPLTEVPLCGHATLATAHTLWQQGLADPLQEIRFDTQSGRLTAVRNEDWITLNFPSLTGHTVHLPQEVQEILGVTPVHTIDVFNRYLVEVATEAEVYDVCPDFARLTPYPKVIVTAKAAAGSGYDFISRFFAPCIGINEDPVTGSAHCCLAPYWSAKLGKPEMQAYQASSRGGALRVKVDGDRVLLSGQAVTLIRGAYIINN
ncbi:PhzF family phenazine biosynthesis protein [uncultured Chitinophaga sp.]|jgi:phenazine biosynthesis protein PhzF family|uniref:PhzF family phenazine biosynthesis protein n=1 Tax=uncultured Chitinophaga sp. TaxID=339340 RepID=UPI0026129483|nr:PhzF family phenazine biosynthesis protein [uncultured Chitinophaga sp.]